MRVAVIGGTGMLGRPVMRVLAGDPRFEIRVLVRVEARARRLLPARCTLITGDLRERGALDRVMDGADALYMNLSNPFSARTPFDPERDGTPPILDAARAAGIRRVARISALEAAHAPDEWWLLRRKADTDRLVAACGIPYTIFLPTWYFESIPLFLFGRAMMRVTRTPTPLHWIAGEDYARQVAAALLSPVAADKTYAVQGPEALTFREAIGRFVRAYPRRVIPVPMPRAMVGALGLVDPRSRYLADLLGVCMRHGGRLESEETWRDLGRPTMTAEDYALSIARTGDLPRK